VWLRDLVRARDANRVRRFAQAAVLATEAEDDLGFLYAHFLHTPSSVARYAAIMRGLPWGFSAHAKDIWTSAEWEKREKIADAAFGVTCTGTGAEHLGALGPPGRVDLVYHGLDLTRLPDPPEREARDGGPFTILSVGRLVGKKGYDLVLDALAGLPPGLDWRFVHIGGGSLGGKLAARAERLGIAERVEWRGAQARDAVFAAMRGGGSLRAAQPHHRIRRPRRPAQRADGGGEPEAAGPLDRYLRHPRIRAGRRIRAAGAAGGCGCAARRDGRDGGGPGAARAVRGSVARPPRHGFRGRCGDRPGGRADRGGDAMTRLAFHAPMKPPDHPTPSGDRRVARLFVQALRRAGYAPEVASTLRSRDGAGDAAVQDARIAEAGREIDRIARDWADAPPALWFTYHCYYKAPDLIGPALADRFGIPYVIAEASRAQKRLTGPWAAYAARAEAAMDRADLLLAMTAHDRFALDRDAVNGQRIADFPPFLDPGPAPSPAPRAPAERLELLTVAMMRGADKLASYRALADILRGWEGAWHLTIIGDGPQRAEVEALFAGFGGRVTLIATLVEPARLREHYERADAFVWPGVNEAYGMVYLEAQAAGTPVVAQDWPGPRSVIAPASAIVPRDDAAAFRAAIRRVGTDPRARGAVRAHILDRHGIDAAAARLSILLGDLT